MRLGVDVGRCEVGRRAGAMKGVTPVALQAVIVIR
jgi:hypothetical protein